MTSYFDYWFGNIVSASRLISSPVALPRAWIGGDATITSAYDVHELMEQLLGDLRLRESVSVFEDALNEKGAFDCIVDFAQALTELDKVVSNDLRLEHPEALLASSAWHYLQAVAKRVTELPAAKSVPE